MVFKLDLALVVVVGCADIVMRGQQQAGAFSLHPWADGFDFLRGGFLLGRHVVESEDQQGAGVGEDPLIAISMPVAGKVLASALIKPAQLKTNVSTDRDAVCIVPSVGTGVGEETQNGRSWCRAHLGDRPTVGRDSRRRYR
jgi:hypothetical protein